MKWKFAEFDRNHICVAIAHQEVEIDGQVPRARSGKQGIEPRRDAESLSAISAPLCRSDLTPIILFPIRLTKQATGLYSNWAMQSH